MHAILTSARLAVAATPPTLSLHVCIPAPPAGAELCQLHLDTMSPSAKRANKCIVMARFYRGADGRWAVASVGSLCQGNTADYGPMLEGCRAMTV
jgi:hypothetical protein